MDRRHHRHLRRTALSAALLTALGTASADDAEVDALTKPESWVSVGGGNWSAGRPQQGIYDGMGDKGFYGLLDADIRTRNEETGTWLNFTGTNIGLDTRELRGEYLRQGLFGAFLEYSKTPRDNPYTINTRLQGIGSTHLVTGTNLGAAPLQEVELGTVREMFRLGGHTHLMPGLALKLDFRNEEKTGTRQTGWGSAALFSVEPIDSTTQQLDAILDYSGERLQVAGGYSGSRYDNNNPQILQQLYGVTGGTNASFNAITPLSQPLSNTAHQLFADGGYSFSQSTRGSFKAAYTLTRQDENLPSSTLTGANAPFVGAPAKLDGEVRTTLLQLGLSSRPLPKLNVVANLRYYDMDDRTPLAGFVGNNTTRVATVYNTPQSYTTNSGKLEATYRLPQYFNLTGGVDYSAQNRSAPTAGTVYVPYRQQMDELTYRAQLRRSMGESLNGSVAYFHSKRGGGGLTAADGTNPYSNQVNPIHVADRNRDKWRLQFDWAAMEHLSLQFRFDHARDTYPDNGRPYGPKDGTAQVYALDASYAFSEDWVLAAWYARDINKTRQTHFRQASTGSANAVVDTQTRDAGDSVGMSLRAQVTPRISGSLGIDWYRTGTSYAQDFALSGAGNTYPNNTGGPLADINTNLLRFKFDTTYAMSKSSDLRFDLVFERWHTDDWTWELANGAPFSYYSGTQTCTGCTGAGYTGVVDGTTVTAKDKQISTFIGLRYIYKFQ